MKLKTLKDIEYQSDMLPAKLCDSKLLRREAIRWLKAYRLNEPIHTLSAQRFIKCFFNITEAELK